MVTISDSRTIIQESGEAKVSDLNGTKKKIRITPELVVRVGVGGQCAAPL